jgi:S1-C subfamily serine protease
MNHPFRASLLTMCALLCAATASAQEITELGVVPDPKPQVIPITGKPLSGEQIFDRSVLSLVFILVEREQKDSFGSGFFATDDGLIVTNAHVVKGAKNITVTAHDEKSNDATILLIDEKLDLAVLKAPQGGYPKVTLANRKPKVGSTIYAIGNPSGLSNTISKGLISGIRPGAAGDRNSDLARDASRDKASSYVIQHTAAISGGSSGGMLLAETGEVIGVNTFALTGTEQAYFAVSASDVESILALARKLPQAPSDKNAPAQPATPPRTKPAKSDQAATPPPATDEFDFKSLPPSVAQRLTDNAENYAIIGYHLCNVQLYNTAQKLAKSNSLTTQERDTLAYLLQADTPLIYTASGKTAWHSVEQALKAMMVSHTTGRIIKIYGGNTLVETSQGPVLINKIYPGAKTGDEIQVTFSPEDVIDIEMAGKTTKATKGNWCYTFKSITPESLGSILVSRKINNLLSIQLQYQPAQRIIHEKRIGRGVEYTAEHIPATFTQKLTQTPISLPKKSDR